MENGLVLGRAIRVSIVGMALAVSGCGGGSDGGSATPAIQSGVFVDAPVQGLAYRSGATTGFTDALGTFRYETGQPVTFTLGSVVIGTIAAGKATVFPTDLVPGAIDETDATVSNMVRLLQTLDDDGDPSNGILITSVVRDSLTTPLDFAQSKVDFAADPVVVAAVATATALRASGAAPLKDAASAEAHFRFTLLAAFAGTWHASFVGTSGPTDYGNCTVTVNAQGAGSGSCLSVPYNQTIAVAGNVQSSGSALITGVTNTGATFSGSFTRTGSASGTWGNTLVGSAGTWQATRN
ncbi:MAG: hypothetical protein KIT47_20040 [Rhodoferax sp.]|nr:hypothetical protein [Rhodoferax sp.]